MAKIVSASAVILTLPAIVLSTTYGKPKQLKKHVIVRLTEENGLSGYGEATPLPKFTGETPEQILSVLERELLPAVIGLDSSALAEAHRRMDQVIYGNKSAKMAIDTAMYDLSARSLGVPAYVLLGGKVNDKVMINRHIGIEPESEAVELAASYVRDGYHSIKIKIGLDVDSDISRVRKIREAVGPEIRLRVDANGGYDYPKARYFIKKTEDCAIEFYEQMLPAWDIMGLSRLSRETGACLSADESINSFQDAVALIENRCVSAFVLKLIKIGGLYPALQIAGLASAYHIQCFATSTYDTHLNVSACLHLAAAMPNLSAACDLTCFATKPDDAVTCHTLKDGYVTIGDAPGFGVLSFPTLDSFWEEKSSEIVKIS